MPAIGLGTFGSDRVPGERVAAAVHDAIRLGYRHIDCAAVYGNEHLIGESLEQAMAEGVRRDELWITSKLWNDNHEPAKVAPALERSLRDLRLDHLDLYLVHWPFPNTHQPGVDVGSRDSNAQPYRHERYMETWAALETARGARAGAAHRDVEHDDPQAPPRAGLMPGSRPPPTRWSSIRTSSSPSCSSSCVRTAWSRSGSRPSARPPVPIGIGRPTTPSTSRIPVIAGIARAPRCPSRPWCA